MERWFEANAERPHAERAEEALWAAEVQRMGGVLFKLERVAIRTGRVLVGLVFVVIAWIAWQAADSIADIPFAQLTITSLAKSIAAAAIAWYSVKFWWRVSFGAAPTEQERRAAIRRRFPSET